MVEQFLDGKICLMLTQNDVYLLKDFDRTVDIHWASGDRIDSGCTRRILCENKDPVYAYANTTSIGKPYMLFTRNPNRRVMTLEEFLGTDKDCEIAEDELLRLFK